MISQMNNLHKIINFDMHINIEYTRHAQHVHSNSINKILL